MDSEHLPLTIGLEFEFALVALLPQDRVDTIEAVSVPWVSPIVWSKFAIARNFYEQELREELANKIRARGFDCETRSINYSTWVVNLDASIGPYPGAEDDDQVRSFRLLDGTVVRETSSGRARRRVCFTQVELISPVLQFDPDTFETTTLVEIRSVLEAVREMPVLLNRSCGFHVHIGRQAFGFNVKTLKNLLSIVSIGQFQLDQIFSADRLQNSSCAPVTAFMNPHELKDVFRIGRTIENVQLIDDLVGLVHRSRHNRNWISQLNREMAWNFLNLRTDGPSSKKTIECRQHQATLDVDAIHRWILLTTSLVSLSDNPNFVFAPIIAKMGRFQKSNYNLLEFLKDLGLSHIARMYQGHIIEDHEYWDGLPYDKWRNDEADDN